MECKFLNNNIVDRDKESEDIINIINACKVNTVIITASKSGIGKSTLSKKIHNQISDNLCCVYVTSHQINTDASKSEGKYLEFVFSEFYNKYNVEKTSRKIKNRKYTLKYFIKHKCKKTVKKDIKKQQLNEILSTATNKFRIVVLLMVLFLKKTFKLDYYDFRKYIITNNTQANRMRSEYIKYLLSQKTHCICIDNIQNIDNSSYRYFEEWLCDTLPNKNIFILEYTLQDEENFENIIKIRDAILSTGANSIIYKLDKMCPEYAFTAILNKYPTIEENKNEILNYYSLSAKGNIRKIEDYVLCNGKDKTSENFDPAIENIAELSNESKFVLALLSLQKGTIDFDIICNLFETKRLSFSNDIQFCLIELVDKYNFSTIEGNNLLIKHASILDAWNKYANLYPTHNFIAYRELDYYYSKLIEKKEEPIYYFVQKLLDLYVNFDPIKIYHLIPHLKSVVYNHVTPKRAWEYIYGFVNSIDTKLDIFVSLIYEFIEWCCDLDLIFEANHLLAMLETQSDYLCNIRYDFCFCKINYLLGNYNTVIDYITRKKTIIKDEETQLYYNLFLIIAYRSTNEYQKMSNIVKLIKTNKANKALNEYGFFLRLAEVYMKKDSCIKTIEESVDFFYRNNVPEQAAKSNISLSYIYAINGETKKALKALTAAESELGFTSALSYIFKVNRACINMLNDTVDVTVWDLLDAAELVVENDFSRLAIVNNKIICCIEGVNKHKASYLENRAQELLKTVPDKHMHAIVSYNLYLMYKNSDGEKAKFYLNVAYKNLDYCNTLAIRLNANIKDKNAVSDFLLTKPWHVCFLSCWEFDYIKNQTV